MNLIEYLKQPKDLEELSWMVQESGSSWNEKQMELFLMLNPDCIRQPDGKWVAKGDDRREHLLRIIDKVMAGKRAVSISKSIMPEVPYGLITNPAEVISIAIESERYESPKEDVIRHRK